MKTLNTFVTMTIAVHFGGDRIAHVVIFEFVILLALLNVVRNCFCSPRVANGNEDGSSLRFADSRRSHHANTVAGPTILWSL